MTTTARSVILLSMATCPFCNWVFGHDARCPVDKPVLVKSWKRGWNDGYKDKPRAVKKRWAIDEQIAYTFGYDLGMEARSKPIRPSV